ncbi:unnamed protein product [Pseudo-nitzschia multistriata]|uniref:Uncharacterized protein n=1 Tax=Pseudo-nitzschia multistriata TaxID=183589 RepID=A0A448Z1Y9_9STRA|nr:unnamed protein product [Pseudo-nitzschia multistriata]
MEHQEGDDVSSTAEIILADLCKKETEAAELKEALKNLLDSHVRTKRRHAKELSEVHKQYSKRLVQLEIDLETHDIHFTNYAKDQMGLETKAILEDKKECAWKKPKSDILAQQNLIAKLIAENADLEHRYKRDCTGHNDRILELENENRWLRRSLRRRVDSSSSTGDAESAGGQLALETDSNCSLVVEKYEKQNTELLRSVDELKEKIRSLELKHVLAGGPTNTKEENGKELSCNDKDEKLKDCKIALLKSKAIAYQARNIWPPDTECSAPPESLSSSSTAIKDLKEQIQELENILIRKDKQLRSQSKRYRKTRV